MLPPVCSFPDYEALVSACKQAHRRCVSNMLLPADDIVAAINEGRLFYWHDGGLLLFYLRRHGTFLLYYYAGGLAALQHRPDEPAALCEIFERESKYPAMVDACQQAGLVLRREYTRMAGPQSVIAEMPCPPPGYVFCGTLPAPAEMLALLRQGFDPVMDHLPEEAAAASFFASRHVLCLVAADGSTAGLVVYNVQNNANNLDHIWVAPSRRGQGLSTVLMAAYLAHSAPLANRRTLWVAQDNAPALRLYEAFGYTRDALQKAVFATGPAP